VGGDAHVGVGGSAPVSFAKFLSRFQVELTGWVERKDFGKEVVMSVFQAILRADLSLREMFALFDRNCSGTVSFDEFREVMESFDLGLSRQQLGPFFRALLGNSADKKINVVEFLSRFDVVFGGHVHSEDAEWIHQVLSGLGKLYLAQCGDDEGESTAKTLLDRFEKADTDGNGTLSLTEFVREIQHWKTYLERLGVSPGYLTEDKLFEVAKVVDISGEGSINYLEWIDAFQAVERRGAEGGTSGEWVQSDFGELGESILMVLYRNVICLRRGLQYFDPTSTGTVTLGQLKLACMALASALSKPDPPFSEKQVMVLLSHVGDKKWTESDEICYTALLDSFNIVDRGAPSGMA